MYDVNCPVTGSMFIDTFKVLGENLQPVGSKMVKYTNETIDGAFSRIIFYTVVPICFLLGFLIWIVVAMGLLSWIIALILTLFIILFGCIFVYAYKNDISNYLHSQAALITKETKDEMVSILASAANQIVANFEHHNMNSLVPCSKPEVKPHRKPIFDY